MWSELAILINTSSANLTPSSCDEIFFSTIWLAVVGGAGYIGTVVSDHFLKKGFNVMFF